MDNRSKLQKFWSGQINEAKRREEQWRKQGDKVVKCYRTSKQNQFNILWANTEILKAATFSRLAPPNVTRRFKDDNPVARDASEVLERCLEFQSDDESFVRDLRKCRDDMLLPGRGTIWFEYDADFELTPMQEIQQPPQVDEAGELIESEAIYAFNGVIAEPDVVNDNGAFMETVARQRVTPKYVYWKDYLQSDSRGEEDVWWKARRHGLSVDEIKALLGEDAANKVDLPTASTDEGTEIFEVWEIWSKPNRKRIWFTDRANDALEVEDVPLRLKNFFPSPKPLFPFETTNTMIPVPEYLIYQNQAQELNDVVERLTKLTKLLKVAGVYNGANSEAVVDLSQLTDGQYKAIQNAAAFQEKGGFASALFSLPLQETIQVISGLEQRKQILKSEIFEITGISDVVRGDSQKYDTASAQRLKGSYGSLRLRPRREPMEEFIRDCYSIMAEIVADKFTQSSLSAMTGLQVSEEVMGFLRGDALRDYHVDVETDSTVQPNEEIDMRKAMEYTGAVGNLLQQTLPAVQQFPQLAPFLGASLKFVSRQFKAGRVVEQQLNELVEQMQMLAQQPPQGGGEDAGKAQIEQAKLQLEAQKLSLDAQKAQMDAQTKLQVAEINNETKVAEAIARQQSEAERTEAMLQKNRMDIVAANARR